MEIVDYILDGLEAALELERELGVRSVEIDRGLLEGEARQAVGGVGRNLGVDKIGKSDKIDRVVSVDKVDRPAAVNQTLKPSNPQTFNTSKTQDLLPLIFLHDRPLSPGGVEMMAKIITALGRTPENSPIVIAPPVPKAKIVVILGGRAMKKYYPDMKGEPGQWIKLPTGEDVLVTYSPEYILRFGTVTPAVQKLKQDMWRSLKAVAQRLR